MDYEKVKKYLSNFDELRKLEVVEKKYYSEYETSGDFYEVFKVDDETYIRLIQYVDSYGQNATIEGLEIVKPTKVVVSGFETI